MSLTLIPASTLAALKPKPVPKITERDRLRWQMYMNQHLTIEEISVRQHCSTIAVQKSIDKLLIYSDTYSRASVEMATNKVTLKALADVERIIDEAAQAVVKIRGENGEVVETEPDLDARMKVCDLVVKLLNATKAPAEGTKVDVDVNQLQINAAGGGGKFEGRLREIREKLQLSNNEEENVVDAEIIEDEDEDENEEEEIVEDEPAESEEPLKVEDSPS